MKSYPSIQGPTKAPQQPCIVFLKYDGSNLRFEWSKKQGWHKFGTRNHLFDAGDETYGPSIQVFQDKYADALVEIFNKDKLFRGVDRVVVFGEWFGAKSFAGSHEPDDPKDLVLFDVNPMKKGFISPRQFVNLFGHLPVAEVIREANFGPELIAQIRHMDIDLSSEYAINQPIPEGVVCKGGEGHKLWMAKIKTDAYKEALKSQRAGEWEKYWE